MEILLKAILESDYEDILLLLKEWKVILSYSRVSSRNFSSWLKNNNFDYIFSGWWFNDDFWDFYFFYKKEKYIYSDVESWVIDYIKNDLN